MPEPRDEVRRGTRGRIVGLLHRQSLTVNELAARLGLTHNAVRVHLVTLQHDGLVAESGARPTGSRPAVLYALAPGAEASFSRAYVPFAAALVQVLADRLPESERDEIMREVGRRLADGMPPMRDGLAARVEAAALLLEKLGGSTEVVIDGSDFAIRGHGCPLGEVTHDLPDGCRAIESLLGDLVKAPVQECCDRGARPKCRFRVRGKDSEN